MIKTDNEVDHFLDLAARAGADGRGQDSRKFVRRALTLDPDNPRAQLLWAIEQLEDPLRARYHLRRAAALGEGDPAIEYQIACVLLDLGDVDAALLLARRASRHVEGGFRFLPGLVNLTGRLADARGDDGLAEQALGLAFALEPEMAWHGRSLAQFLHRQGRRGDALRVALAALEHAPEDPGLRALVARLAPAHR
jgi:tetratricopeptide (TPR) repeat protein